MTGERSDVRVVDNPGRDRFEALLGGQVVGFVDYRAGDGVLDLVHTEVDREREGRGVGSALIAGTLDEVRARGLRIIPTCPFVAEYVGNRPEYDDLVAADGHGR